jgi:hypothetical protein
MTTKPVEKPAKKKRPQWTKGLPHNSYEPKPLSAEVPGWFRQAGESDVAYHAFEAYRDLGGKRQQKTVVQQLGKAHAQVSRWANRWSWEVRCKAYDLWRNEQRFREKLEDTKDALDQFEKMGKNLAIRSYNALLQSFGVDDQGQITSTLSPGDLIRLHVAALDTWKMSLGIPDRVQAEVTGKGGGPVQHEASMKIDLSDIAEAVIVLRDAGAVRYLDEPRDAPALPLLPPSSEA